MNQTHPVLRGACHCGAVQAELRLGRPVEDIPVRACQCGFCRRHGAANVSDAAATQVLLCPVCGVYVGGMIEAEGQRLATLNVAGLAMAPLNARTPEPAEYGDETPAARLARRVRLWTPVEVVEDGG